jgi:DNA repair protein RadC
MNANLPETDDPSPGHRARLRSRFLASSSALTDAETLELLLSYAIPRRDVAPLARQLLERFGDLSNVVRASQEELLDVPGIGEQVAILVNVVANLCSRARSQTRPVAPTAEQPTLFETAPDLGPLFKIEPGPEEPEMRAFVNDEIANSLTFVPQASQFGTFEAFKTYLRERLPFNSESTRERRGNHILNRFFPQERLDIPLAYYASRCASQDDLKPVLFYHLLKAEPLAAKAAEEYVWPALPIGRVDREGLREFILRYLPDIGPSSQKNTLRSVFTAYDRLSVGVQDGTTLRFQVHPGTFEAFLYILTAEFAEPGMYRFEQPEQGPMRRWLLWDREWMHRQLYNLRDLGILSKVSQIDTLRQFTLQDDQWTALRRYFEHPGRGSLALRDRLPTGSREDGETNP